MTKFVLCRPQGGLNDMLVQIEACVRYVEKFDRTLIVETDFYSHSFEGPLSDYFVSRQANLILDSKPFVERLKGMDVFPRCLTGKLYSYPVIYDIKTVKYREKESQLPITFDFSSDYDEKLLVHHQLGGGESSQFCLKRMRLRDSLADQLADRLRWIGMSYWAIHIRNTDLTTNYRHALTELHDLQVTKLFVATDNKSVLNEFILKFGQDKIITFAALPDQAGRPLHYGSRPGFDNDRQIREAILDLLTLACARVLFLCRTTKNSYSGFSLLAKNLFNDKTTVKSLLNDGLDDCWLEQAGSFAFMF